MGKSKVIFKPLSILVFLLFLTGCAGAAPDIYTMFDRLMGTYPNIWRLVTACSYVLGFLFGLKAVYSLKVYGQGITMTAASGSLKTPITYFLVCGALIFIPTTFHVIMNTSFGHSSPLDLEGGRAPISTIGLTALLGLVQILGVIAFIRGWLYIARTGDHNAQPNMFAKGITHILGGVAAVNIVEVRDILWRSFGGF